MQMILWKSSNLNMLTKKLLHKLAPREDISFDTIVKQYSLLYMVFPANTTYREDRTISHYNVNW